MRLKPLGPERRPRCVKGGHEEIHSDKAASDVQSDSVQSRASHEHSHAMLPLFSGVIVPMIDLKQSMILVEDKHR